MEAPEQCVICNKDTGDDGSLRVGVKDRKLAALGRGVRSIVFGVGDGARRSEVSSSIVLLYNFSDGLYRAVTSVRVVSRRRMSHAFSSTSTSVRAEIKRPAGGIRMNGGGEIVFRYVSRAKMLLGNAALTPVLTAAGIDPA